MKFAHASLVSLHLDRCEPIEVGDIIITTTWRSYVVANVRTQKRGKHVGRQHVRAFVAFAGGNSETTLSEWVPAMERFTTPRARVHAIRWNARGRRGMNHAARGRNRYGKPGNPGWT